MTVAPYQVVGVTVSRPVAESRARVRELAAGAAGLAGIDAPLATPTVLGGWIGPGYGLPSAAGQAAARWSRRPRACSSTRCSGRRRWPR